MNAETGTLDQLKSPIPGSMPPEYRALLLSARAKLDSAQETDLRKLLNASPKWHYLLDQAARHGLTPLLCHHQKAFRDLLPVEIATRLDSYYAQNTRRNLALVSTLFTILDRLESAGIKAVPYKGPVLSASLYGHLGCRECADVDVLVPVNDALRAKRILQTAGLAEVFPAKGAQNASRVRAGEAFEFIAGNGALVELQWQPLPRAWSADIGDGHWTRLESRHFAGRRVQSFSAEDLLLILALHGAKHAWQRFIWVSDIHELVEQNPALDWATLLARADAAGVRRCVLLALRLAQILLGTALPEAVASAMAEESELTPLVMKAIRMATGEGCVISAISAHGYFLRTRERLIDRSRFYFRFATTPGYHEWNLISLPERLYPLYSVVRMLRVAGKMVWNPYSSPLS